MTDIFIPLSYQDVVAVYDAEFNQLFSNARAIRVQVDRPERLTDQPIEDGSVTTDFRITDPIGITMMVITQGFDYQETYAQIIDAKESMTSLIVQTKAAIFDNIFIVNTPHEEDPEKFDVLAITIRMREILIAQSSTQSLKSQDVSNPDDQSSVSVGQQTPQQVPDNSSALAKISDWVHGR